MDIDPNTGLLSIDSSLKLRAGATIDDFLSSAAGQTAEKVIANGAYRTFKVRSIGDSEKFHLLLTFKHQILQTVTMSRAHSDENDSWEHWSEVNEQKRKRAHDAWLYARLGQPPYRFDWGAVSSDYDPHSGSSSIVITYRGSAA